MGKLNASPKHHESSWRGSYQRTSGQLKERTCLGRLLNATIVVCGACYILYVAVYLGLDLQNFIAKPSHDPVRLRLHLRSKSSDWDAQAPLQLHSAAGSPDLATGWDNLASVPVSDAKEKGSEETAEPVPGLTSGSVPGDAAASERNELSTLGDRPSSIGLNTSKEPSDTTDLMSHVSQQGSSADDSRAADEEDEMLMNNYPIKPSGSLRGDDEDVKEFLDLGSAQDLSGSFLPRHAQDTVPAADKEESPGARESEADLLSLHDPEPVRSADRGEPLTARESDSDGLPLLDSEPAHAAGRADSLDAGESEADFLPSSDPEPIRAADREESLNARESEADFLPFRDPEPADGDELLRARESEDDITSEDDFLSLLDPEPQRAVDAEESSRAREPESDSLSLLDLEPLRAADKDDIPRASESESDLVSLGSAETVRAADTDELARARESQSEFLSLEDPDDSPLGLDELQDLDQPELDGFIGGMKPAEGGRAAGGILAEQDKTIFTGLEEPDDRQEEDDSPLRGGSSSSQKEDRIDSGSLNDDSPPRGHDSGLKESPLDSDSLDAAREDYLIDPPLSASLSATEGDVRNAEDAPNDDIFDVDGEAWEDEDDLFGDEVGSEVFRR